MTGSADLYGDSGSLLARFCRSRVATVLALGGSILLPIFWAIWIAQQDVLVWVVAVFWVLATLNALDGGANALGYDFTLRFKWYDLWVGAYIDHPKRTLYVCPLPCVLLTFESRWNHTHSDDEPHIRLDFYDRRK